MITSIEESLKQRARTVLAENRVIADEKYALSPFHYVRIIEDYEAILEELVGYEQ